MKTIISVLLVASLFLWQCSHSSEITPVLDFEKESIKLMQELAPQLVGRWNLHQVHIKFRDHNIYQNNKLGLTQDTVFRDLAMLTIQPASNPRFLPKQEQYPEFEGTIELRGKSYPIYFYLMASPEGVSGKAPQAFFLFKYNFPDGMHIPDAEENFLQDIGLAGDNFSLELVEGQPAMIWRGLNRGINKIDLQKL